MLPQRRKARSTGAEAWPWLGAAVALLAVRAWIIAGHPLPLGALGDPQVLLANKLQGWFHLGTVLDRWSWSAWGAGLWWEWLPAILSGIAVWRFAGALGPSRLCTGRHLRHPFQPVALLLVISTLISCGVFEGIPHVQDSIAQQFQAQIFASGRLWAPVPAEGWVLRSEYMVQHQGRWFAQYPPGHAALLSVGTALGVPWLVCPLLGSLSALMLWGIAKRLYGTRTAALATWLFCLSPFVWFMSGERMNHVSTLFWVLVALWLLVPALRRRPQWPSPGALGAAGAALGLATSTRPLCGAAWMLVVLIALATLRNVGPFTAKEQSRRLFGMAACGTGIAIGVAPMLAFNAATTGSLLISGYELQWGSTGWGFGRAQWGPPHTLGAGLQAAWSNWDALGKYLFEWPLPGTLLLAGCTVLPRWRRSDRFMLGSLACVTAAYVPYFFQDLCLGPRFLYAALPAVLLLCSRGALAGSVWLGQRRDLGKRSLMRRIPVGVAALAAAGFAGNGAALWRWYACDFWGTSTRLVRVVERQGLHHAVIFIRDRGRLRCEELRRRGIPLSVAQAAVDDLSPEWIDAQIAAWDRAGAQDGRLARNLREALADPTRRHYRQMPPWVEAAGFSSNVNFGFWANGPTPETQKVIYALHPGKRLPEVLPAFGDRTAWAYDWDAGTRQFLLKRIGPAPPATTSGR